MNKIAIKTIFMFLVLTMIGCSSVPKKNSQKKIETLDSGLYLSESDEEGVVELVIPEMIEYTEIKEEVEQKAKLESMELGNDETPDNTKGKASSPLSLIIESELKPDIDLRREKLKDTQPKTPVVKVKKKKIKKSSKNLNIYVVQRRDTLYLISKKIFKTKDKWQEIVRWNSKIFNKDKKLIVGQRLKFYLPNQKEVSQGRPYIIQKGDDLMKISKKVYNGIAGFWTAIWDNNKDLIENPNEIQPGFTIFTPAVDEIQKKERARRRNPYKWEPSRAISGQKN